MTNQPLSADHDEDVPGKAAEHLNLAERFATFADYAASTEADPQTAATSLDVARFHAFTGEVTFAVEPAVRLYLDGGSVYHAERDGDPSITRLILDAGVIDPVQLQRGVVSVGDVEHLGRLFDRDTTVDRDAVMVVVETATDALVQLIANSVVATVTVSAYRHHPSGLHRWFVAPVEPTGSQRPSSGVTQVDRSVVEELPRLGASPALLESASLEPVSDGTPFDDDPSDVDQSDAEDNSAQEGREPVEMSIEWSEPNPVTADLAERPDDRGRRADADIDIQAELDRFDADHADWTAASGERHEDQTTVASPLGEFRIVWPDGSRDDSIVAVEDTPDDDGPSDDRVEDSTPTPGAPSLDDAVPSDEPAGEPLSDLAPPLESPTDVRSQAPHHTEPTDALDEEVDLAAPGGSVPSQLPAPDAPGPGPLGFTIDPLQVDQIPAPDDAIPADVATAVRRALQAIERASHTSTSPAPELHVDAVTLPELTIATIDSPQPAVVGSDPTDDEVAEPLPPAATMPAPEAPQVAAVPLPAPQAAARPFAFAPPTPDMRAEAVYERAAVGSSVESSVAVPETVGEPEAGHPTPGKASVVFVDDEVSGQTERRGALRRLIGSLRNRD